MAAALLIVTPLVTVTTSVTTSGAAVADSSAHEYLLFSAIPTGGGWGRIIRTNLDGTDPTAIAAPYNDPGPQTQPTAAPDGSKVAYIEQMWVDSAWHSQIRILDLSTGLTSQVPTARLDQWGPRFSPNGTQIAFLQNPETPGGFSSLHVVDLVDGGEVTVTDASTFYPSSYDWQDDGHLLVTGYEQTPTSSVDGLFSVPVDGSTTPTVVNSAFPGVNLVRLSPDGTRLAALGWDSTNVPRISTYSAAGGSFQHYLGPERSNNHVVLAWSPDGTRLLHAASGGSSAAPNLVITEATADGTSTPVTIPGYGYEYYGDWYRSDPPTPVDTVAPSVAISAPTAGQSFTLGATPSLTYTCTDDVDPAPECVATADGGTPVVQGGSLPSTLGTHTVTLTGTDHAANTTTTTTTYTVSYGFSGLTGPVSSTEVNKAKAGSTTPFRFRLTDANNNPVLNLTTVTVSSKQVACGTLAGPLDAVEETSSGSSGLRNLGDGNYQWNWATAKSYANTCRVATIQLGADGAGGSASAPFSFTK